MRRGSDSRAETKAPARLACRLCSQHSSDTSSAAPMSWPPAEATRMSRPPNSWTISCRPFSMSAASAASPQTASPPVAAATSSSRPLRRPITATRAPSAAKRRAQAAPIPVPPPTIRATFPCRLIFPAGRLARLSPAVARSARVSSISGLPGLKPAAMEPYQAATGPAESPCRITLRRMVQPAVAVSRGTSMPASAERLHSEYQEHDAGQPARAEPADEQHGGEVHLLAAGARGHREHPYHGQTQKSVDDRLPAEPVGSQERRDDGPKDEPHEQR